MMTREERADYNREWRRKRGIIPRGLFSSSFLTAQDKARQSRKYKLKTLYGLSLEAFDKMLIDQCGICFLCDNTDIERGD